MSYLTDDEHRILLAALRREKEFCSRQLTDSKRLVKIVQSLERKFYYDRFEKEIRDKVIEEFAEALNDEISEFVLQHKDNLDFASGISVAWKIVDEIAEQMKEAEGKKPITYSGTNRADCPTCGATVRGISKPFGKYCSHCGQKLDWSAEQMKEVRE